MDERLERRLRANAQRCRAWHPGIRPESTTSVVPHDPECQDAMPGTSGLAGIPGLADAAVEVVGFRPELAPAFRDLNLAWLEPLFGVEEPDRVVLEDPAAEVLGRGGEVLFALAGGEPVGTCALLRRGDCAELAKMAVATAYRGRGIGRRLGVATIARARAAGYRRLFLLTSPRLEAAVALYRSLGFHEVAEPPAPRPPLSRCSIVMDLDLGC
jgi:GNAT superfamily N-acetyltransferase